MVSKWAFGGKLELSSCRDMDDVRSYVEYAECNRNAMPIIDSTRPRVLLMINIAGCWLLLSGDIFNPRAQSMASRKSSP